MGVKRRTLIVATASILATLVTGLSTPIITHSLVVQEYGEYASILATFSILVTVTDAGFFDGVRKFLVEHDSKESQSSILTIYLTAASGMSALGAVAIFTVFPALVNLSINIQILLSILLMVRLAFLVFRGVLIALNQELVSEAALVSQRVSYLLLLLGGAQFGLSIATLFFIQLLSEILSLLIVSWKIIISSIGIRYQTPQINLSRLGTFSVYTGFISVGYSILYNSDILILSQYVSTTVVAQYKAAIVLFHILSVIPSAIKVANLQSASRLWENGQFKRIERELNQLLAKVLALVLIACAGLLVVGREFIPVYFGEGFGESYILILLLLPGALCYALAEPIYSVIQGSNNQRMPLIGIAGASMINISGSIYAAPRFGAIGVAVATSFSYIVLLVVYWVSLKMLNIHLFKGFSIRKVVLAAIISVIVGYSIVYLPVPTSVNLFILPPVMTVVFLIFLPRPIYSDELEVIKSILYSIGDEILGHRLK